MTNPDLTPACRADGLGGLRSLGGGSGPDDDEQSDPDIQDIVSVDLFGRYPSKMVSEHWPVVL
jgi:hypothetical protein